MTDRTKTAYENWAATYDTDPNPHTALEYRSMLETLGARRGEKVLDAAFVARVVKRPAQSEREAAADSWNRHTD
jgi:hypothetical protein